MSQESINSAEAVQIQALSELEALIRARYPETVFEVGRGRDEPDGIYLTAIVDLDDPDEVMDLVIDRLLTFQVDEGLAIHVVPIRTQERVADEALRRSNHPLMPVAFTSVHPSPQ